MAAESGRQPAAVASPAQRLAETPERFDFFQAVRILELLARRSALGDAESRTVGVGRDSDSRAEPVRFRALASLGFPASPVVALTAGRTGEEASPPEMVVSFLGLAGATGALPRHYTELVVQRLRVRDRTLRDFLGLFDHRAVSLFHRAWEKYRFAPLFERSAANPAADDSVTLSLRAVVGRATAGHRDRVELSDDVFLRFCGHFSRRTRPAACLEAILADYFEVPVQVEQFQGEMLRLPAAERTRLPSASEPYGRHGRLGSDAILGGHAFDVKGRFRIRVGPVRFDFFRRLMPTGELLRPFCQLARSYVGPEFAFDVRPVLVPNEAPPLRLGADPPDSPRLGWNTWLRAAPIARTFDGVSFSCEPA